MQEFARYSTSSGGFTYSYILLWELISQDIPGNYSTIKLQSIIQVEGANYISWTRGSAYLHTDNFDLGTRYNKGNTVVHEMTVNIGHESDGTKTVNIGGGISTTYLMNGDCNGNITLPTIPRYAEITRFDLSRRNETTASFTWEANKPCDTVQYSVNGSGWITGVYPTTIINWLSPNSTYNVKIRVKAQDSQLWTESQTKSVTTYKVPTQSLNTKNENSIKINWSCDSTADYIWYSKDNGVTWVAVGSVNASSGSYTISSLNSGTTYNIKTRVRRQAPQTTYDTTALSVTTDDYVVKINVNGTWKNAVPYIKVNGTWKKAIPYFKVNGNWKAGIH